MINIVIPMAGEGKRFRDVGYKIPKPFIPVYGKPMIERVLEDLFFEDVRFVLYARKEHIKELQKITKKYPVEIIPIKTLTDGMVSTILHGREYIDNDDRMLIASCDQLVGINIQDFLQDADSRDLEGSLMTFYATHPKWSYVKIGTNKLATEVREKEPISTHANVGIYYYRRGSDFIQSSLEMIEKNDRVNNEFYAAPTYNYFITKGGRVGIFEIQESQMYGLGTPEDLDSFVSSTTYFKKKQLR